MPQFLLNLNRAEWDMVNEMLASPEQPCETKAEWFRLLIHREYNRRKGKGKPEPRDYQTAFRNIRPLKGHKAWNGYSTNRHVQESREEKAARLANELIAKEIIENPSSPKLLATLEVIRDVNKIQRDNTLPIGAYKIKPAGD